MKLIIKYLTFIVLLFVVMDLNGQLHETTLDCRWRNGPGVKYKTLGIIKSGERVNVIKKINASWSQIEYNGKTGFISNKYLILFVEKIQVEENPKPKEITNAVSKAAITKSTLFYIIAGVLLFALIIIISRSNKQKKTDDKTFYEVNESKYFDSGNNVESVDIHQNDIPASVTMDEILNSNENTNHSVVEIIEMPSASNTEILDKLPNYEDVYIDNTNMDNDGSIIDITGQEYPLINVHENLFPVGIPSWKHQYVYSASEIHNASSDQIKFYNYFKHQFLKGQYIDIQGNSNYAFILLFDLIDNYENHKNILQVQRELNELGQYYPKTKPYAFRSLIKKLEQIGDYTAISEVKSKADNIFNDQRINSFTGVSFDGNYWGLGTQFKKSLPLTNEEVEFLNTISYYSNNFFDIKSCSSEVIKLFLALIKELNIVYGEKESNVKSTVLYIADIITTKQLGYRVNTESYKYTLENYERVIYTALLKMCENAVREKYLHKRKLNTDLEYLNPEYKNEYHERIISKVLELLPKLTALIIIPDENTEIELNCRNTTRWKLKFEELIENYNGKANHFLENIINLGHVNKRNLCIENIFFEASKFIAKSNKETALKLYIHYLYHDLQSTTFDNKQLTKTIQKNLFKTNEQLHDFEIIVSNLVTDKNLEIALQQVSNIYAVKRKKIQLDTTSIKEVQQQHSGTVELLNEYLKDEYEDESNTIQSQELTNDVLQIVITQKQQPLQKSIYTEKIAFDLTHTSTIELFVKNNFIITQKDLESFTKSKNVFMNQHIDSINEVCFDYLNDILIEEEDECYTINPDYYQRLLNT